MELLTMEPTITQSLSREPQNKVVPKGWERKSLGDILKITGGGAFKSRDSQSSGLRWLKISNVGKNKIEWNDESYLPKEFGEEYSAFLLNEGVYVLALTRPILGRDLKIAQLSAVDAPCLLNQRVGKVEGSRGYDSDFVYYLLQSNKIIDDLLQSMAGTDPPNLSNKAVYSILTTVPVDIYEQKAIAKALSDVDALISNLDKLITKKRAVKEAAMHQLLSGSIRLEPYKKVVGFKQTELGAVPEDWINTTFGDVLTGFTSGMTPYRGKPEFYKGNIRWITSGELNYNVITDTIEKITSEAVTNTNLKILPKGTFLMAITGLEAAGTRGSCGIVGEEATTNQSCMALFPTKSIITEYLYHFYVKYGNELAFKYCQGTKQQSYTARIAKILPIHLPPTIEEQRAIATTLSDIDAEIGSLKKKKAKYQSIKQGMMQELLTGKTRLV